MIADFVFHFGQRSEFGGRLGFVRFLLAGLFGDSRLIDRRFSFGGFFLGFFAIGRFFLGFLGVGRFLIGLS